MKKKQRKLIQFCGEKNDLLIAINFTENDELAVFEMLFDSQR
jgi:hypothetical protein